MATLVQPASLEQQETLASKVNRVNLASLAGLDHQEKLVALVL